MQTHKLLGYSVELDREATQKWYDSSQGWGCECAPCRHFLALARKGSLPAAILKTLKELGIPAEKATYVGELYTDETGIHYQFSYRLVGAILSTPANEDRILSDQGRCCHEPYPYGAPNFPTPHFDLEFYVTLPHIPKYDPM